MLCVNKEIVLIQIYVFLFDCTKREENRTGRFYLGLVHRNKKEHIEFSIILNNFKIF